MVYHNAIASNGAVYACVHHACIRALFILCIQYIRSLQCFLDAYVRYNDRTHKFTHNNKEFLHIYLTRKTPKIKIRVKKAKATWPKKLLIRGHDRQTFRHSNCNEISRFNFLPLSINILYSIHNRINWLNKP